LDTATTKATLRSRYLSQRKALVPGEVARRSAAIADQFFGERSIQGTLHLFLPIARQNEVDTWLIIHRLWRDFPAVRVAVSVTDVTTGQLTHYPLLPDTVLTENRWGIPEPLAPTHPIPATDVDLVLVPLLAFDMTGHRVGYGKGYYDRFLATCRPDCLKIGLSLFGPVERITDAESTDIRLDSCLTPEQAYVF